MRQKVSGRACDPDEERGEHVLVFTAVFVTVCWAAPRQISDMSSPGLPGQR